MRRVPAWGLLAAMLAASAPGITHAQGEVAARDAQARFEEGLERVKAGDFEAARLSFAQAYAVLRRPAILWNLALSEEKTGHLLDALAHFKLVARDSTAVQGDRDVAERHAAALMGRTGHIVVDAVAGTVLQVDADPTESVAPLSEPIDVEPGHHVVHARLTDGTKTVEVDAGPDQVARVSFTVLEGAGHAASPERAPATPGGTSSAATPSYQGAHRAARPAQTARIATTAALGGAAAVALGLGIYFGLRSRADADSAQAIRSRHDNSACFGTGVMPSDCANLSHSIDLQNREAIASDVLYATAGVLAAGAVVTWFLFPKRPSEPPAAAKTWVTPVVGPDQLGFAAGGTF